MCDHAQLVFKDIKEEDFNEIKNPEQLETFLKLLINFFLLKYYISKEMHIIIIKLLKWAFNKNW